MKLSNLSKIAIKALGNNKMRCFLTMLGVIIGVGAVIAMLAIGQGSKNSIKAQISEMGSNMIMIMPGAERRGGVRQSSDDMQTLKPADYDAVVNQATLIDKISPMVSSSGQWVNGNNNYPSQAQGVNTQYLDIRQRRVAQGEMFTEADVKTAAKVCVLGKTLVNNLFPDGTDPIGKIGHTHLEALDVVDALHRVLGVEVAEAQREHVHGAHPGLFGEAVGDELEGVALHGAVGVVEVFIQHGRFQHGHGRMELGHLGARGAHLDGAAPGRIEDPWSYRLQPILLDVTDKIQCFF